MRALRSSLLLFACGLAPSLASAESSRCTTPQLTTEGVAVKTHKVERGESLSGIALRYGASVQTVALANGLGPDRGIRAGQSLVIPVKTRPGGGDDWMRYTAAPKQRGRLELIGHKDRFSGQVMKDGKLLPSARQAINVFLGAKGTRPPVPDRLIRLLVRVSDTFGGRPLYVVSGYRTSSFYADSHHKRSEAVDFSIVGVPNVVLRQYLLLLDNVGVGFYPRSSFVHLDVRQCPTQWVDYSGPYEPPRRTPPPSKLAKAPAAPKADRPRALAETEEPRAAAEPEEPHAPPEREDSREATELERAASEVISALEEAGRVPASAAAPQPRAPYARR
jgi:uncharacterized protein YcbK (DUF882 family)